MQHPVMGAANNEYHKHHTKRKQGPQTTYEQAGYKKQCQNDVKSSRSSVGMMWPWTRNDVTCSSEHQRAPCL